MGVIDQIIDPIVRGWYEQHGLADFLDKLYEVSSKQGFILDPKHGWFFRRLGDDNLYNQIGYMVKELILPRPTYLHHHTDVDEAIYVIRGHCKVYLKGTTEEFHELKAGKGLIIPMGVGHVIGPDAKEVAHIIQYYSALPKQSNIIIHKKILDLSWWL